MWKLNQQHIIIIKYAILPINTALKITQKRVNVSSD